MTRAISDEHVERYKRTGYTVIERHYAGTQLAAIQKEIHDLLGPRDPAKPRKVIKFPFGKSPDLLTGETETVRADTLNDAVVDEHLVDFLQKLIGAEELHLNNATLEVKYPGGVFDQQLHLDVYNNSLVVPDDRPGFHHLQMIIYWEDVTLDNGPTHVLSREHRMPTTAPLFLTKDPDARFGPSLSTECRPDLYEREVPVTVPAGSMLIYSMSTYHRGTDFRGTDGRRVASMLIWRARSNVWNHKDSYVERNLSPVLPRFLAMATPRQRCLLGFPPIDSAYWNERTVEAVGRRYPGMDMTPYRAAVTARDRA